MGNAVNDIHVVGARLHYIFQGSKGFSVLGLHLHADHVGDIVLVFLQRHRVLSWHKERTSAEPFHFIDSIQPLEFDDHKLLEKFYALDLQRKFFPSSIQKYFFQIPESSGIVCRRKYLDLSADTVGLGHYAYLQ